jgi:hypothetical protein
MRFAIGLLFVLACKGGDETDTDTSDDTDTSAGTVLRSYDPTACAESTTVLSGAPDVEDGHFAAAALTPSGAFTVAKVGAELLHDPAGTLGCDASLAGRFEVYVTTADAPPANATPDAAVDYDAATVDDVTRIVEVETPDLDVADGERIFVAIRMAASASGTTCVRTCTSGGSPDDAFWSNADAPPYDWAPLSDFDIDATPFLWASEP